MSRAPAARSSQAPDRGAAQGFAAAWDELVLAIRRLSVRAQPSAEELTLAQYYLVRGLARAPAATLCVLADAAGIAPPTATRIVDGLERAGAVRREPSPGDRRAVLVSLTPRGRERLRRKQRQLDRRRRLLYERLAPGERAQSERLLRHLAELIGEL